VRILGKSNFGKKIKVIFASEPDKAYRELKALVEKEKSGGVDSSENQTLLRGIDNAVEILKANTQYGRQHPKSKIPKKYVELYNIDNLWTIELPLYWRLVYTVTALGR
jgi:hypothetical protein